MFPVVCLQVGSINAHRQINESLRVDVLPSFGFFLVAFGFLLLARHNKCKHFFCSCFERRFKLQVVSVT